MEGAVAFTITQKDFQLHELLQTMSPSLHSLVGNLKKGYDNVIKECE